MIVKAWNNGSHRASGAGYGLRISKADLYRHFRRDWSSVTVRLPGQDKPVVVYLTPSFWKNCAELRHQEIGRWLRTNGFAPWPKGRPPKFEMESISGNSFRVTIRKKE